MCATKTARLEITATTLPLVEAEVNNPTMLASLLSAEFETWPPPPNDESSLRWTHEKLKAAPDDAGLFNWYVVLTEKQQRQLIGLVGFKTGYSIQEMYQQRGLGTEATYAIMEWAFRSPLVRRIDAETFPELRPSIRVMERCGMKFFGSARSQAQFDTESRARSSRRFWTDATSLLAEPSGDPRGKMWRPSQAGLHHSERS